ncbi:unnamed protein product [Lasius platythorax]|uniref:Uncharacterized protein n=1 Tax=Lasius platythorax TaxID=488582 RepID=A0AAV2N2Y1_9HYME
MVYVWTVDFDLQNDVSEGSHKLFRRGAKMLGACEESIGATRRVLYARHGAGTRFLYQNVVVVVVPGELLAVEMDLRRPRDISYNTTYGPSAF